MRHLCLALILFLAAPAAAVPPIKSSGPIDRAGNQASFWISSLEHFPDPSFVADGPTATLVLTGWYRQGIDLYDIRIDNVALTTQATLLAHTATIQDCNNFPYTCPQPKSMFLWENVPPQDLLYFEDFDAGIPAAWDKHDLAFTLPSWPGPDSILNPTFTGASVKLGDFAVTGPYASMEYRFEGLTPGETYAVTFWWSADNGFDLLEVDIYGHEEWKDATTAPLASFDTSWGAVWGDFRGDGFPDLYVGQDNVDNDLLENALGSFSDVTAFPVDDPAAARGLAVADADNDGTLDLYLGNSGDPNRLYKGTGTMAFSDVTASPVDDVALATAVSFVDWDNDGSLEIYLANDGTANRLFRTIGGLTYVDGTFAPLDDTGASQVAAWADWDDDGDLDLYLGASGGADKLLRNDQAAGFTDVSATAPLPADITTCVDWGDYDNDGDPDAYVVRYSKPNLLLRNDGGTLVDATTAPLDDGGASHAASWLDFDNDGFLDLYLTRLTGENSLFRGDGTGSFTDATTWTTALEPFSSLGAAWADKDCDGDLDGYVTVAFKANRLLENLASENGNRWLQVDLEGTDANARGIGARIWVTTSDGVTRMREVDGGGGSLSMDSLTAEFGLGAADLVEEVKVRWPGGATQVLHNLDVNQKIRIVEGVTAVDGPPPSLDRAVLHANAPNPFNPRTTLAFTLPEAGPVTLEIFDARGRRVRTLVDAEVRGPGRHEVVWDGTDASGRSVASGSYVYRLTTEGFAASRSLVLVR